MFPTAHTMINAMLFEHFSEAERRQRRPYYAGLVGGEPNFPSPSPDRFDWLRAIGRRTSATIAAAMVVIVRA